MSVASHALLKDGTVEPMAHLCACALQKGRVTGRFDFSQASGGRQITSMRLLFEASRSIPVNASAFEDTFEEMGVHVYEICPCKGL
jgi:hypothetical protein